MREHFLLDPTVHFLNHGSFGACPKPVFEALQQWQLAMERNPVEFLGRRSAALLRTARERLAAHLGAQADDLVFVPNATTGVNTVAQSLALQPGDEILTTDHEYGACDATWHHVCQRTGAVYRRVEIPLPFEASEFADRLMAAVTPRTRLIFVSHLTSTTALVFPLAALCAAARERGIATLVDGAHAPGQIDLHLDTLGADFYTGNCHKWLCAPKGAAFLHVRPERQREVHAPVVSWGYVAGEDGAGSTGGHTGFDAYVGSTLLERRLQWQGTRDIAAWLSVPAALDFLAANHWPAHRSASHQRALALQARVLARNGLQPIAHGTDFGQMVPIPVRSSDPAGLRAWLFDQHRIEVPVTQHAGQVFVRVSVQAYTLDSELQALENALAAAGV
ncbi:aminotransferase class V-fold PLP-dependent enzyme [Rubrivivax rivuli]|uniref:Aminotransferase class V-fold PLP-dependent enzyme n=2 Tax=Rubrivivax rivuli TaxID=1862385 RepID=A0A437RD88_9BURK|nr:aminotransferase class V-fold PLP-dependent enzyme [Rubrivivax rivuli]